MCAAAARSARSGRAGRYTGIVARVQAPRHACGSGSRRCGWSCSMGCGGWMLMDVVGPGGGGGAGGDGRARGGGHRITRPVSFLFASSSSSPFCRHRLPQHHPRPALLGSLTALHPINAACACECTTATQESTVQNALCARVIRSCPDRLPYILLPPLLRFCCPACARDRGQGGVPAATHHTSGKRSRQAKTNAGVENRPTGRAVGAGLGPHNVSQWVPGLAQNQSATPDRDREQWL